MQRDTRLSEENAETIASTQVRRTGTGSHIACDRLAGPAPILPCSAKLQNRGHVYVADDRNNLKMIYDERGNRYGAARRQQR